jgi:hypothetical protein
MTDTHFSRDEAMKTAYQFLHLDVEGIVVLAKEHFKLVLQQIIALLQEHPDILECHVMYLRHWTRKQRH